MKIVRFHRDHLLNMSIQPTQAHVLDWCDDDVFRRVESSESFTALDGDTPIACMGILPSENDIALWSILSTNVRPFMVGLTRAAQNFLEKTNYPKVWASVDSDFRAGHRWLHILGFKIMEDGIPHMLEGGKLQAVYLREAAHG